MKHTQCERKSKDSEQRMYVRRRRVQRSKINTQLSFAVQHSVAFTVYHTYGEGHIAQDNVHNNVGSVIAGMVVYYLNYLYLICNEQLAHRRRLRRFHFPRHRLCLNIRSLCCACCMFWFWIGRTTSTLHPHSFSTKTVKQMANGMQWRWNARAQPLNKGVWTFPTERFVLGVCVCVWVLSMLERLCHSIYIRCEYFDFTLSLFTTTELTEATTPHWLCPLLLFGKRFIRSISHNICHSQSPN